MTDTYTLLMRRILDDPADDTVRLALADWLDEFGGTDAARSRAALIRVGVELARLPTGAEDPSPSRTIRLVELLGREAAILKRWCAHLLPKPLRAGYPAYRVEGNLVWVDPLGGYAEFERGFVGRVGVELAWRPDDLPRSAGRFGGHLRAFLSANPVTSFRVSVEGSTPEVEFAVSRHPARMFPWELGCEVQEGEPPLVVRVWEGRRELLQELPAVIAQTLADVVFVRRPELWTGTLPETADGLAIDDVNDPGDDFAY